MSAPALEPTVFIDGGDLACGELLLLVYGRVRHERPGTQVTIRTTDPAAPIDIPAWCHLTGHLYQGPLDTATSTSSSPFTEHRVELCATSRPVDPAHPWHPQPTTEAIP